MNPFGPGRTGFVRTLYWKAPDIMKQENSEPGERVRQHVRRVLAQLRAMKEQQAEKPTPVTERLRENELSSEPNEVV